MDDDGCALDIGALSISSNLSGTKSQGSGSIVSACNHRAYLRQGSRRLICIGSQQFQLESIPGRNRSRARIDPGPVAIWARPTGYPGSPLVLTLQTRWAESSRLGPPRVGPVSACFADSARSARSRARRAGGESRLGTTARFVLDPSRLVSDPARQWQI
jgi:hypothetical protein